jgi:HAD superfamily hydrolase (TIGR01509 family)
MQTILVDAVNTLVIKGEGVYAPLHDLLERYPNPKIILTNADDEQLISFGLDRAPYPVFTLKHQPNKTDAQYFERMLAHFALAASNVVYIEHNAVAVASAQKVGIRTHHYNANRKDVDSVQAFLSEHIQP